MKRSIIILILAGAMLLALPATAKKPPSTPPEPDPPAVVICDFNDSGMLEHYKGTESGPYKCEWTVEPGKYSFELKAVSGAPSVLRPHLFVTDAYPLGDKCFDLVENGWQDLSYTFGPFTLPEDGACGDSQEFTITSSLTDDPDNVYSLIIAARAKGAELSLWLVEWPVDS